MKLLLCVSLALYAAQAARATTPLLHRAAPEFERTDLQHNKVDLRAYRGKVVLLDFWASWCAPCQIEMPRFVAWQSKYGPRGLQIVGISMDDDPALARRIYNKYKLNYPVAMGDEKLGELYGGVLGLPLTFLIDRQGKIQAVFQGEADLNEIEKKLEMMLRP